MNFFRTLAMVGLVGVGMVRSSQAVVSVDGKQIFAKTHIGILIPQQYALDNGLQTNGLFKSGTNVICPYTGRIFTDLSTIKTCSDFKTLSSFNGSGFSNATDVLTALFSLLKTHDNKRLSALFREYNENKSASINNCFDNIESVTPVLMLDHIEGYDAVLLYKLIPLDTNRLHYISPLFLKKTNGVYLPIAGNLTKEKTPIICYIFEKLNQNHGNHNMDDFISWVMTL
jgi:hypothetical protein